MNEACSKNLLDSYLSPIEYVRKQEKRATSISIEFARKKKTRKRINIFSQQHNGQHDGKKTRRREFYCLELNKRGNY